MAAHTTVDARPDVDYAKRVGDMFVYEFTVRARNSNMHDIVLVAAPDSRRAIATLRETAKAEQYDERGDIANGDVVNIKRSPTRVPIGKIDETKIIIWQPEEGEVRNWHRAAS